MPAPTDLIAISVCEIRRLLDELLWAAKPTIRHILAWSSWRRKHQLQAKAAHIRHQLRFLARMRGLR